MPGATYKRIKLKITSSFRKKLFVGFFEAILQK